MWPVQKKSTNTAHGHTNNYVSFSHLESISKTISIIPVEEFLALSLPQMQTVELLLFGVSRRKCPVNILNAILVHIHLKQSCRSTMHTPYIQHKLEFELKNNKIHKELILDAKCEQYLFEYEKEACGPMMAAAMLFVYISCAWGKSLALNKAFPCSRNISDS
jgi:hypothetical protein